MPFSERQFRFLMSEGSPLSKGKKKNLVEERRNNPGVVHKTVGLQALMDPRKKKSRK